MWNYQIFGGFNQDKQLLISVLTVKMITFQLNNYVTHLMKNSFYWANETHYIIMWSDKLVNFDEKEIYLVRMTWGLEDLRLLIN